MFLGDAGHSPRPLQIERLMAEYELILMRQDYSFCMRPDPLLPAVWEEIRRKPIEVKFDILLKCLRRCFSHLVHENELEGIVCLEKHCRMDEIIKVGKQIYQMDNHATQNDMTDTAQPKHAEEVKEGKVEEEKQEVVKVEEKVQEVKEKEHVALVEKNEEVKETVVQESHQAEPEQKVQEKPVTPPVQKIVAEDLTEYIKHFKTTKAHTEIQQHCKKLTQLIALSNKKAQTLSINLGVGESKGKTVLKYGVSFTNKVESNFSITIEVKIKKKAELHALLQGEIKRGQKVEGYHPYKLCQVSFSETDKSLKIHIVSPLLEEHVLKETIDCIAKAYEQEPVLKVTGQFTIKNSIRNDEVSLQKKQLVKWIAQGLSGNLQVTGCHSVIGHFISPLIDIFPVFKVVRSGEVSLKLRSPASVDKLFQKLGIAQASQKTPSLSAFLSESFKEYLNSSAFPMIADLIRHSIHFSSSLPNERTHLDLSATLSHLRLDFSFSADPCKQLGELTAHTEIFT